MSEAVRKRRSTRRVVSSGPAKVATSRSRRNRAPAIGGNELDHDDVDDGDIHIDVAAQPDNVHKAQKEPSTSELKSITVIRSPGGYSGTTARTSLASLPRPPSEASEIMIDNLANVDDAAVRVLDLLVPQHSSVEALEKVTRNFQQTKRSAGRALARHREELHNAQALYSSELYVNATKTARAIIGLDDDAQLEPGSWRPDDIFYRANLAIAAEEIHKHLSGEEHIPFERLDRDFPEPFMNSVAAYLDEFPPTGASSLLKETFEMALRIRIQLAVYVLTQTLGTAEESYDEALRDIFLGNSIVRGWDTPGLRTRDLSKTQKDSIVSALSEIKREVLLIQDRQSQGEEVDIQQLRESFSPENFVIQYLEWIRLRGIEVDNSLARLGKVHNVQEAIEELLDTGSTIPISGNVQPKGTGKSRTSLVKAGEIDKARKSVMSKALSSLSPAERAKKWMANLGKTALSNPSRTPQKPTQPSKLRRSLNFEVNELDETSSPQAIRLAVHAQKQPPVPREKELSSQHPRSLPAHQVKSMASKVHEDFQEANKENAGPGIPEGSQPKRKGRFIDHQSNAERVNFDDSEPTGALEKLTVSDGYHESSDPSQDTGFEQDQRAARRSKRAAPISYEVSPGKRTRTGQENDHRIVAASSNRARAAETANRNGTSSHAEGFVGVNQEAKDRVRKAEKQPQVRIPWTHDETVYLHRAIERKGVSWARIKNEDAHDILHRRNQVALKDKARNLLYDYLKSGRDLPTNFALIRLSVIQKNQLRSMGIPWPEPVRREE